MAVISELTKIAVTAKLNDGIVEDKIITKNLNLGSIEVDNYGSNGDEKAMNIVELLKPCLAKEVYKTEKTATYSLSSAE